MSNVAFIPLRAGGKRIGLIDGKDKERANLGGHPLMAWTIRHAIDSGVFDKIYAVTNSWAHGKIAMTYGVDSILNRSPKSLEDDAMDIVWVLEALSDVNDIDGDYPNSYSILRVTSPFRGAYDIKKMMFMFQTYEIDSVRMVTPVSQHPGKMWVRNTGLLTPLLPVFDSERPWHSQPTQNLPEVFIQTAGMEIAHTGITLNTRTIAGSVIMPYEVYGAAALDINTKLDWFRAEKTVEKGLVERPSGLS